MAKTPQQVGKEFERALQDLMTARMSHAEAYCHRLYDTRSAGNYIPSQPGDFIYLVRGCAMLLEIKSSAKYSTLAGKRTPLTDLFDNEQVAKMRLWCRAGGATLAIFMDQNTRDIEIWDGMDIVSTFNEPRAKLEQEWIQFNTEGQLSSVVDFLTNYWPAVWRDR